MQRDDKPKSMAEIKQQLLLQSQQLGIYHGVDTQDADRLSLTTLPNDIKRLLCTRYLNGIDALNFFRAAPRALLAVHADIARREDNPLRKLLSHIALGELEAAEKIWKTSPNLLTCRGTIYHPNRTYVDGQPPQDIPFTKNPGRYKYVNRSAFQILLMNSEFKEAQLVAKLMPQGEMQKQFNEIFPDGEIKKYEFNLEEAKKLLQAVFETVAKDKLLKIEYEIITVKNIIMSDITREVLNKLYTYAKPKSEHTIGLVFDPKFYYQALKIHDEQSHRFNNRVVPHLFWSICVEEWLAGCLGTAYLRAHAQGLGNPTGRHGCVLWGRVGHKSPYFAFRRQAHSIPGSQFHVEYYGQECAATLRDQYKLHKIHFENYVEEIQQHGQALCRDILKPKQHWLSSLLK